MDLEQMEYRCPNAELIGTSMLEGYELLFKGSLTGSYATIEARKGSKVPVLIWKLGEGDEERLDRYEGYPIFYDKKELEVKVEENQMTAMVYLMDKQRSFGKPSDSYYQVLDRAYQKFGFDKKILRKAFRKSLKKKGISYVQGIEKDCEKNKS